MNDERKAKRVFIVLSVICAVFPGIVFLVYLLKIAGGLFGHQQLLYKIQEFHQDIYYVILLGFSTIVPPLIAYLCYDEACHAQSGDPANGGGGAPLISQDSLTRERNIFLGGFVALIGLNLLLRFVLAATIGDEFSAIVILSAKAGSVYLVFRLSRYLGQPIWLTILFCVLMPFSLLYLIPFIGLLVAVRSARIRLSKVQQEAAHFFPQHSVYKLLGVVVFAALVVFLADWMLWPETKQKNTEVTTTQPAHSSGAGQPDPTILENTLLVFTNEERTKRGLPACEASPPLMYLARRQSQNMCAVQMLAHESDRFPSGWKKLIERLKVIGVRSGAQNIALRTLGEEPEIWASAIVKGWMNTPSTKENVLDPPSLYFGAGTKECGDRIGYVTLIISRDRGRLP